MLALWVAVFGALTHLLYGVQSYAALMAGITAVVVVIPCMFAPENYMQLALARVECTFIGVLMITLSSALLTPNADRDRFYLSACEVAASACYLLGTTLNGTTKTAPHKRRRFCKRSVGWKHPASQSWPGRPLLHKTSG